MLDLEGFGVGGGFAAARLLCLFVVAVVEARFRNDEEVEVDGIGLG